MKAEQKITAIIVDDEHHGRENLRMIIESYCPEVDILGLAESVVSAKALVMSLKPDVVFLDINMPVLDGFDFLKEYEERDFLVVFVSAHDDYGIKAVKAGAVDYLLKPINIKELKQTIRKLLSLQQKPEAMSTLSEAGKLVIPASHGFTVLVIDEIIRLEADGPYTTIITENGKKIVVSRTLKDFEETLPKEKFYRVHKSSLINLRYIKEFSNLSGNYVIMTDGIRVEISRRKAPDFIQRIKSVLTSL